MEVDEKLRPEKKKKLEEMKEKELAKTHTFKPQIKKQVPNFSELQSAFESQLQQKKENVQPTKPVEFNFLKKQGDSKQTADEDDGLTEKEREEQRIKAAQELEQQKKQKAASINTFLGRNFIPTIEKQVEAQKTILSKNDSKIKELQKQTAHAGVSNSDLIRQVVTPKGIEGILKSGVNIEELLKPSNAGSASNKNSLAFTNNLFSGLSPTDEVAEDAEGDQESPGMFAVETVGGGDQSMPGMPVQSPGTKAAERGSQAKPAKPKQQPQLFDAKKPKQQNKIVDSVNVVTKRQEEVARFKEEKAKEQKKKEEEEKKRKEEAKLKKKKASERVHFKLEEVMATQALPETEKGPSIGEQFKAQTDAYEENKGKMIEKVEKKACLVEESNII